MNGNNCCICNILKVISVLQDKVSKIDDIPSTCDRPFLGFASNNNSYVYNTRPISLYNKDGSEVLMPYTLDERSLKSSVFRVEKVDGCCTTLRVLAPNSLEDSLFPYITTNDFFTVNCNCICAMRCLGDTYVDGV